jgi:glyoxylase-like metal-dependent hydrolase (beta-lactamase superfamily II)
MDLEATTVRLLNAPNADSRIGILRAGDEVDAFVVFARAFVLLADTFSTPELARRALELLRPRMDGRPLLVLNTHADHDHAYGNRVFAPHGEWPTTIIGHRLAERRLTGPAEAEKLRGRQAQSTRYAQVQLIPPSLLVDDALTLAGGDLTLELLHTPGHTEDHLSVWIPERRTLLAGDAAESPFPHVVGAANLVTLRATLTRLGGLGAEVVLACHGQTTRPDLPALNLAYFDRLETEAEKVMADLSLSEGSEGDVMALAIASRFSYADALRLAQVTDAAPFYQSFHDDAVQATIELLRTTRRGQ